jgi:hypothetical protein
MRFNKETHTYTHNGEVYKSVSEFIGQYFPEFKKDIISSAVAKRDGLEKQDVLDKWKMKGEMAQDYGNAIHTAIEMFLKYGEKPDHNHLKDAVDQYEELNEYETVRSEIVFYCEDKKIAGTSDLVVKLGNKEVIIRDIKTNGDLHKDGYNKMKEPFKELEDSKLNKYRLQLSVYKYLAEVMGLKVKKLEIWYWDGNKFEVMEIEPIDVFNYKSKKIKI